MASLVGIVCYQDDQNQGIFRKVFPQSGDPDTVLDDPRWVTEGCDPSRTAIMLKVPSDDPRVSADFTATP